MEVVFYTSESGRSPVVQEIESLPIRAMAHLYEFLDGVENHGLNAPRIIFRPIQGKLWEIKVNLPQVGGYRVFYFATRHDAAVTRLREENAEGTEAAYRDGFGKNGRRHKKRNIR